MTQIKRINIIPRKTKKKVCQNHLKLNVSTMGKNI